MGAILTAEAIRGELEEAWREAAPHGVSCDCCMRGDPDKNPTIEIKLRQEAMYALSTLMDGAFTDETDDSLDELMYRMADAALEAAHVTMTTLAADALTGKVVRL